MISYCDKNTSFSTVEEKNFEIFVALLVFMLVCLLNNDKFGYFQHLVSLG